MVTENMAATDNRQLLDLAEINRQFRHLAAVKNWQAYHTPKNLVAAIAVEAAELLAEFQWLTAEESQQLSPQVKSQVGDEIADVLMYLTELCEQLNINMAEAVQSKIQKNMQRFHEE